MVKLLRAVNLSLVSLYTSWLFLFCCVCSFITFIYSPLQALTKLPKDYPDKKSLPHVQVAMRMQSRNEHIQPGDVIPYIVCQVRGGDKILQEDYLCRQIITFIGLAQSCGFHLGKSLKIRKCYFMREVIQ